VVSDRKPFQRTVPANLDFTLVIFIYIWKCLDNRSCRRGSAVEIGNAVALVIKSIAPGTAHNGVKGRIGWTVENSINPRDLGIHAENRIPALVSIPVGIDPRIIIDPGGPQRIQLDVAEIAPFARLGSHLGVIIKELTADKSDRKRQDFTRAEIIGTK